MKTIAQKIMLTLAVFAITMSVTANEHHNLRTQTNRIALFGFIPGLEKSNTWENDGDFLVYAAEMNMETIQFGKLAQKNSPSINVKDLGWTLETSHTAFHSDLTLLAAKKLIVIPRVADKEVQEAFNELADKTGKEFDQEYLAMVIDDHKKTIEEFEKASKECQDPEIRKWANSCLPDMRNHLDRALECKKQCDDPARSEN